MPLGINGYVDPGVYIRQRLQPGSVTITTERNLAIVGIAPRTRRVTDEVIIRGRVYEEAVTFSSSSPYIATLANVSDRDRADAGLIRNGHVLGLGDWGFLAANLVGAELGGANVDVSTLTNLTLSIDKKDFVKIDIATTMATTGGTPATATAANIVDAINYELSNPAGTYYAVYGSDYTAVASFNTGTTNDIITLTSPVTTATSDVQIILSAGGLTTDAASVISNAAWVPTVTAGVLASTRIQVADGFYSSSDTFEITYNAVDLLVDALAEATTADPLSAVIRAGSFPGSDLFVQDLDYGTTTNYIDWDQATWEQATVVGLAGPYTATGTTLKLAVNGRNPITVTLTTNLPNPAAADIATDINAALAGSALYGPIFAHVASDNAGTVELTAPSFLPNLPTSKGSASNIEFFESTTTGVTDIFGIASTSLPFEQLGVGTRPDFGTNYYTTYDYQRPSSDYNTPTIVYNNGEVYDYTSPLTLANYPRNQLAVAGEIAFANGVSSVYLVQIDDSTAEGTPTPSQVNAGIDGCKQSSVLTDITVLNTDQAQAVYLMDHVADQSSITEKNYRRAWYGMARDTDIGNPDTPNTLVYRATRVLQPGNTSSGRGRQILCAPCNMSKTLVLEDRTEVDVDLDGSYLSVANAARFCALDGPSDALLRKTVSGFLTDSTFQTYEKGERGMLASNGVNVTTLDGGRLILLDPLTTEAGGAKVIEFEEPSSSAQKDAVTRTIEDLINENVVGLVPDELVDFITEIKTWAAIGIRGQITDGNIGPYLNANGTRRDLNMLSDIQAYQSETDKRSFTFKYWFNLKYVAKRFYGEFSVDNPFFS